MEKEIKNYIVFRIDKKTGKMIDYNFYKISDSDYFGIDDITKLVQYIKTKNKKDILYKWILNTDPLVYEALKLKESKASNQTINERNVVTNR